MHKVAQELLYFVSNASQKFYMRKKNIDRIGLSINFVSQLLYTLRYMNCQPVPFYIYACLVWGFVASLAITLLKHHYGKFEIPWPSLNWECYQVL